MLICSVSPLFQNLLPQHRMVRRLRPYGPIVLVKEDHIDGMLAGHLCLLLLPAVGWLWF